MESVAFLATFFLPANPLKVACELGIIPECGEVVVTFRECHFIKTSVYTLVALDTNHHASVELVSIEMAAKMHPAMHFLWNQVMKC